MVLTVANVELKDPYGQVNNIHQVFNYTNRNDIDIVVTCARQKVRNKEAIQFKGFYIFLMNLLLLGNFYCFWVIVYKIFIYIFKHHLFFVWIPRC